MRIVPSDATLGAVVTDVDLGSLDEALFAAIESAWHHYAVLVFPGQALTDAEHVAFTRRFGRLERGLKRAATAGLGRLSNVDRNGTVVPAANIQARFQRGNREWHSDSSYKRVGAKASILAAHVTPTEGGETEWADMRAAWAALEPTQQEWLADKNRRAQLSVQPHLAWRIGDPQRRGSRRTAAGRASADAHPSRYRSPRPLRRAACEPHRRRRTSTARGVCSAT